MSDCLDHRPERKQVAPALSAREQHILAQIAQGKAFDAIAVELRISRHTVYAHARNICDKMQLRSIRGLRSVAMNPSPG